VSGRVVVVVMSGSFSWSDVADVSTTYLRFADVSTFRL
jgi:hypothetical protein